MGIKWLNEAKDVEPYLVYRNANTIQEKDQAVADGLAQKLGEKGTTFSRNLNSALGLGFLSSWMNSFKWENLVNEGNPFIRLLSTIANYSDGNVLANLLTNKKPTPIQRIQSTKPQANTIPVESYIRWFGKRLNEAEGVELSNQVKKEYQQPADETSQSTETPQEQSEAQQDTAKDMPREIAKLFDMTPREVFNLLYNGYLKRLYTTNDFAKVDNDPDNNITIKARDGKEYSISRDLGNVVSRCLGEPGLRDDNSTDKSTTSYKKDNDFNDLKKLVNSSNSNSAKRALNKIEKTLIGKR